MFAKVITQLNLPTFWHQDDNHLKRLSQIDRPVKLTKIIIAFIPSFLRSSCSGSAAQDKKVTTSLAIWEAVAGVPSSYSTKSS
ncbi:hypothetical protein BC936DRAFT_149014 [Jimgerdemannia flammicorona]|uniref:Uncharacterized protein n=1 Tax=Jimgerdemannia flammicorona TaxID=994334 RepID=A0A433DKP9_9FUNG|nr:hypothetical protein BC936DRAFT_149014 [Jimgerdemannia flammicorona]